VLTPNPLMIFITFYQNYMLDATLDWNSIMEQNTWPCPGHFLPLHVHIKPQKYTHTMSKHSVGQSTNSCSTKPTLTLSAAIWSMICVHLSLPLIPNFNLSVPSSIFLSPVTIWATQESQRLLFMVFTGANRERHSDTRLAEYMHRGI